MAARKIPSLVSTSTGSTDATGAWTHVSNAPLAIGNVYIVHLLQDGTNAGVPDITSVTNAENIAGTDNVLTKIGQFDVGSAAAARQHLWIGRSTSTSAMTITGSNSGGDDVYVRVHEFTGVNAGTTLSDVIENVTAGSTTSSTGTSATASDASVTSLGSGRLALNFLAVNDDNIIQAISGATGGRWNSVGSYADSGGTDGAIEIFYSPLSPLMGSWTPTDVSVQGSGGSSEEMSQHFVGSSLTITSVIVFVGKQGSPTDDLIVEIQTDSGGLPSGTVVATGDTISGTDLSSIKQNWLVPISAALGSSDYHLVFRRSGSRDTSNYFLIGRGLDVLGGNAGIETRTSGTWSNSEVNDLGFAFTTSAEDDGSVIDGATVSITDSDAWGMTGFALIGTAPAQPELNKSFYIRRNFNYRTAVQGAY